MNFPLFPLFFGRKCQPSSLKFGFDAQVWVWDPATFIFCFYKNALRLLKVQT